MIPEYLIDIYQDTSEKFLFKTNCPKVINIANREKTAIKARITTVKILVQLYEILPSMGRNPSSVDKYNKNATLLIKANINDKSNFINFLLPGLDSY